ncbi:MAG: DUF1877 family protein [Planctomycetes bacterium]|nr:DUF1877 family protein [Planctomycetota bacterium]MCB9889918.1 DUF1877 family protein [Planctomycetota bacterium]
MVTKAWDAIHRCPSDGTLTADGSPRASPFFGGRWFHKDDDYIVNYLDPDQARPVLNAIAIRMATTGHTTKRTSTTPGTTSPRCAGSSMAADAGRLVIFTVYQ